MFYIMGIAVVLLVAFLVTKRIAERRVGLTDRRVDTETQDK
jgi:hypothetical protein